jgi:hypothetical protein
MSGSTIEIGLSVNLIAGLSPAWDPRSGETNILCPSKQQAMTTSPPQPVDHRGAWSFPDITLHDSALSLLAALIPYRIVNPASFTDAPVIGAGALLAGAAGSRPSLEALSKTIGVDLTNPDFRYALVTLRRHDGSAAHASAESGILVHVRPRAPDPAYGLNAGFISASIRARHAGHAIQQDYGDALNKDSANTILDSFAEYGTHYVSAVELGDTIAQVFAYPSKQFESVKQAYADGTNVLSGPGSEYFAQFTTDLSTGAYGYVTQYGQILSASNSAAFNTTLKNGDWSDTLWSHKDSVFALFNTHTALSWSMLVEKFKDQAPIGIQLAPLVVMYEQKRGLLWQRVFKGAMAQKYRTSIQPNFGIYDTRDFAAMLPEDQSGILSEIATPSINVYKTRIDLAKSQLVAVDQVKDFTVLANVLSAGTASAVHVPGAAVRLFGQVMDMRAKGQPRAIVVTDGAFESFQIACDEFLGAMAIQNESGTGYNVIVDGLVFGLTGGGADAVPIVTKDIRTVPPVDSLPFLLDSIQYSMAFAEAVISDQSGCPNHGLQEFVRGYLTWLARCIPASVSDESQLALRVRALDLAKYAVDPGYGSLVPILPSADYDALINSILSYLDRIQLQIAQNELKMANRRLEERVIDVGKTLNANIIASGQLLSGVIEANAAQQKDLVSYYDGVVTQQKAEAEKQQASIDSLEGSLMQARGEVDAAQQHYKAAVQQWETMEAIKLGLDIATNLFSLATSIAIPASAISAVKDLGLWAQRIQKGLNVLNAASKLYTGAATGVAGLTGAQDALDGLDEAQFGQMSSLTWDEMNILFTQILATGPDVKEAKAGLQAAFSTLVLRGKAVASAKSSLHAIQRDIYTSQQQKIINQRQADRFEALKGKLQPARIADLDKDAIDLVGLTGYLSFIQNQMLAILAKAFLQKDLALQYANLQPATPVMSFSLLKFSAAIVQQNGTTVRAREALLGHQAAVTTPIEYLIEGVMPAQLTGGNVYAVTIYPDAVQFLPYVDARVVAVVATVDGVESTDGGTFALKLAFDGMPFHDRDIQRNTLNFHTVSRERIYIFDEKDGSPRFRDEGKSWSEEVSRVTPFSGWHISFPATSINKGIKFNKDRLAIRLSFVLEARIVDAEAAMRRALVLRLGANAAAALIAERGTRLLGGGALPPSTELIAQIFAQGSVTNNWDVVFNMGLSQINKALQQQYEALKSDPNYTNVISVDTSVPVGGGVTAIAKFKINYGYPQMTFSTNSNNTVQLNMQILEGSTVQRCSKAGSNPEACDPAQSVKGETLTASVDLAKVSGEITTVSGEKHSVLEVRLDMAQGAFSISNIQLSDAQKVELNAAIKAYFVNNPVIFLINRLDLTNIPTLDALKPCGFLFKTLETPLKSQMLQLFIMTGNRALLNQSQAFLNNFPEPLPLESTTSMIIRSGLIFNDVLPGSLASGGWALEGVDPGGPTKAWSGKFSSASVQGAVDLSKLDHSYTPPTRGIPPTTYYTYSIPGGNTVSWSLSGTTLTVKENGQLQYSGNHTQTVTYTERQRTCSFSCSEWYPSSLQTEVTVNVLAVLSVTVDGTDRNQTIKVGTSGQGVTVTGHLSGGGPSNSDDLQAQINQQISAQVPSQIAAKLSFPFQAISVFALQNLLFPAGNYISFNACAIPGDMLLLGNFK